MSLTNFKNLITKYNCNIKGIVHVGGHVGDDVPAYIESGIQKAVFFEPLEHSYVVLQNAIQNNSGYTAIKCALGSEKGDLTLHMSSNSCSSSLLKPKAHLHVHPDVRFSETCQVEVRTLDSFELLGINFLSIDVQGYELEVLKGAKKTLEVIDYIMCEVNFQEMYEGCALSYEIEDFLSHYGFKRKEHFTGAHNFWGDTFFIKEYE